MMQIVAGSSGPFSELARDALHFDPTRIHHALAADLLERDFLRLEHTERMARFQRSESTASLG